MMKRFVEEYLNEIHIKNTQSLRLILSMKFQLCQTCHVVGNKILSKENCILKATLC